MVGLCEVGGLPSWLSTVLVWARSAPDSRDATARPLFRAKIKGMPPLPGSPMGLTYFKRFRMEFELSDSIPPSLAVPIGYELLPYSSELLREHATAKYQSFRSELDANVFPCLGRRDGCLRLMREITSRAGFVPEATWLCRFRDPDSGRPYPVGTIQGLQVEGWGAVQNLGIDPAHRSKGLGSILMSRAAEGFRKAGLTRIHLEVTTDNTAAVRLYERIGFRKAKVVYKAAEVAGA